MRGATPVWARSVALVAGVATLGFAFFGPGPDSARVPTHSMALDAPTTRSLVGAPPEDTMGLFSFTSKANTVKDIRPGDIAAWRGKARFVDVREPHEFNGDLGHIDGAELAPLATIGQAMQDWDKEQPVVVICRSGGRSGRAAEVLARAGFTQVMNLAGGMMGYQGAGLAVVRR